MPTDPTRTQDDDRVLGSPYGPQPYGTDEAAGGADSSPHETEPSGQKLPSDSPEDEAEDEVAQ